MNRVFHLIVITTFALMGFEGLLDVSPTFSDGVAGNTHEIHEYHVANDDTDIDIDYENFENASEHVCHCNAHTLGMPPISVDFLFRGNVAHRVIPRYSFPSFPLPALLRPPIA